MKNKSNLTSFEDHLNQQYGVIGTKKRDRFENEFEAFRFGVLIRQLRKKKGMTQQELAERCGTTKTYISRIENNASDVRLSTLMKIVQEGLGSQLKLTIEA